MWARRALAVLFLIWAPALCRAGLEVRVAAFVVLEESGDASATTLRPEQDLLRSLAERAAGPGLIFRAIEAPPADPIRTYLDAASLCQSRGYGLLLYGYVKRNEFSVSAEVKLLDAQKGEVAASFFNSDDAGHYARLMQDLAVRITDYFYQDVGLDPSPRAEEPQRNLVSIPASLGYWTPAGGAWGEVLAGLASVSVGFQFVPARPLFTFLSHGWQMAFGLEAEYALGLNQPAHERFFLHEARVRLPVSLAVDLTAGHLAGAGAGPLLVVDAMIQDQLYASSHSTVTTVGGISFAAFYRFAASDFISLGFTTVIDVAFYSRPLVTVSPRFGVELRPWQARHGAQP